MPRKKTGTQLSREIAKVLAGKSRARTPRRRGDDTWRGSAVQALLFARPEWIPSTAKAWAHAHGYVTRKVHATEDYVRMRQFAPTSGRQKRTITFGDGIKAVIEQVR